jgi:hypothetical protein
LETKNEGLSNETHQRQPHISVDPGIRNNSSGVEPTLSRDFLNQGSGKIFLNNFRRQYSSQRDVYDPHHFTRSETAHQQFEHIVSDLVRNKRVPVVQVQVPCGA